MLLAPMLSDEWNGRSTVSKECGRQLAAGKPCRFCRIVCVLLSYRIFGRWYVLEPGHCEKEAQRE